MLILDTCVLLWLADDQSKLSPTAVHLIRLNATGLFVSAFSAFELAQKHVSGRLQLPLPPAQWFRGALLKHGIEELPVTSGVAISAAELPRIHRDPADRIIVATAKLEAFDILSPDGLIAAYPGVTVRW